MMQPVWLLLSIPALVALRAWKLPSRILQALRHVCVFLIIAAMCGPFVEFSEQEGTLVVAADRSKSMPVDSDRRQTEIIDRLARARGENRMAVVAFGREAVVESSAQKGEFGGFAHELDRESSNLAAALESALSLIPEDGKGRILLISDGNWTGDDPMPVLSRAGSRGIAVDHYLLRRGGAQDLAVARIETPERVDRGEAFSIAAWVHAPTSQKIGVRLKRGSETVASGTREVFAGLNRLTFADSAGQAGASSYHLELQGQEADPVSENNHARFVVGVEGKRPILCVSPGKSSGLARLLEAGSLDIRSATPQACDFSLEGLSSFSAVILENVPAQDLGSVGMANIAAWIQEREGGLFITGGQNSYAPGGYFRSPLEPVMPVSMELQSEKRKFQLAIAIVLDRSGSMAAPVGDGRNKMQLANLASSEVLEMLNDQDEFGLLAVDTSPHSIVPLGPVSENRGLRDKILRIESTGGGIYVYVALVEAARMLQDSKAQIRHIVLFADAADSEEPGNYRELLAACQRDNITVSVVGLGNKSNQDAALLEDIAALGRGTCFFTEQAQDLPRIFAQDTFQVLRSSFVEEPTPLRALPELLSLTGSEFSPPSIGGYNLCYARPGVRSAIVSADGNKSPILCAWQAGSGRVICYAGEADGKFAGEVARWSRAGDFFGSLARWASGKTGSLPHEMAFTQTVEKGICRFELHLDPESADAPFSGLPVIRILRGVPGQRPKVEECEMRWMSPDSLGAQIRMSSEETALATLKIDGLGQWNMPPVRLPYSPEFQPSAEEDGSRNLMRLALATGGRERISPAEIWEDVPRGSGRYPIAPWILLLASLVFLLEILERRTGLVSSLRLPKFRRPAWASASPAGERASSRLVLPRRREKIRKPAETLQPAAGISGDRSEEKTKVPESQPAETREGAGSALSAMKRVQQSLGKQGRK